ncbi:MAG: TraR/DksA C4-type zinc finger protein [Betaproteobacteria bacterium]|nr:TraR/DksA C4-type zinc finger protein [Betaproteobacteria bacterium]MBI3055232.1 TraR/DksA C4-type zinc finger protein [Betaproteobacteria bacterium]
MALRKKQKLEIERIIKERRAKIAAELQHDVEKAREEQYPELAGAPVTDTGDQASADLLSDLDNAELSRDLLELRELDAALARVAGRKYGTCVDCGGDIGFERLSASPTAVRCFHCQRVHEKTFFHPSEPKL